MLPPANATTPRPAACVLVVRGAPTLQVLLVRRKSSAAFLPDVYVFPGGTLDPADYTLADMLPGSGADEPDRTAAAFRFAALRECFEECGLWLGHDAPLDANAIAAGREALRQGRTTLAAIGGRLGAVLSDGALLAWSRWTTPLGLSRRFDTAFFLALAPAAHSALPDGAETAAVRWIEPAAALCEHAEGALALVPITVRTLRELSGYLSTGELFGRARTRGPLQAVLPRMARGREGEEILVPGDAAFAEAGRIDPGGTAPARCYIEPDVPTQLGPALWRITAPNPGMMSGAGTNSYVLGQAGHFVIIDPGPAIESHLERLSAFCAGGLRAILVTHTHADHSPGAAALAARTGAMRIGLPAPAGPHQDPSFVAERCPRDDEVLSFGSLRLRAIHTPGHASNHVCWWLEAEAMLFSGDHLIQGSTVVIDPPDGDMGAYLHSLGQLAARLPALRWLAPGHGFLMDEPQAVISQVLAHRQARERKVLEALDRLAAAPIGALLPGVYADVPAALHPMASRSLLAHLLKLKAEGVLQEFAGVWHRAKAAQR